MSFSLHLSIDVCIIAGVILHQLSSQEYSNEIITNTEIFLSHEMSEIFETIMNQKDLHKNDFYLNFPSVFGDAIHHFMDQQPCQYEGCVLPSAVDRDENMSHYEYLITKIKTFTVFDFMSVGQKWEG